MTRPSRPATSGRCMSPGYDVFSRANDLESPCNLWSASLPRQPREPERPFVGVRHSCCPPSSNLSPGPRVVSPESLAQPTAVLTHNNLKPMLLESNRVRPRSDDCSPKIDGVLPRTPARCMVPLGGAAPGLLLFPSPPAHQVCGAVAGAAAAVHNRQVWRDG